MKAKTGIPLVSCRGCLCIRTAPVFLAALQTGHIVPARVNLPVAQAYWRGGSARLSFIPISQVVFTLKIAICDLRHCLQAESRPAYWEDAEYWATEYVSKADLIDL